MHGAIYINKWLSKYIKRIDSILKYQSITHFMTAHSLFITS